MHLMLPLEMVNEMEACMQPILIVHSSTIFTCKQNNSSGILFVIYLNVLNLGFGSNMSLELWILNLFNFVNNLNTNKTLAE